MSLALRDQLCSLALSLILVSRATPQSQSSSVEAVMAGDLKLLQPTFRIGIPIIMCFSAFLGLAVI